MNAALANGTLAYYCDIEPHHVGAILHGPAVIVPTASPWARGSAPTASAMLAAMVLGVEVAARVSYALDPVALYNRGFHPSAVCGAFGAAAAAGHLLRLDAERQAVALGLAMQQASRAPRLGQRSHRAFAPAQPGARGAKRDDGGLLARLGFGGPPAPFEGKYDVFTAFSGSANPDALLDGWGTRFYLPEFGLQALLVVRVHPSGPRRPARPRRRPQG